jgi:hypothetical protein
MTISRPAATGSVAKGSTLVPLHPVLHATRAEQLHTSPPVQISLFYFS